MTYSLLEIPLTEKQRKTKKGIDKSQKPCYNIDIEKRKRGQKNDKNFPHQEHQNFLPR